MPYHHNYNMVPPYQVMTTQITWHQSTPTRTITSWPSCLKTNLGHQPWPGCISSTTDRLTPWPDCYKQRKHNILSTRYRSNANTIYNTSTMAWMPNNMFNDKALRQNNTHIIPNITTISLVFRHYANNRTTHKIKQHGKISITPADRRKIIHMSWMTDSSDLNHTSWLTDLESHSWFADKSHTSWPPIQNSI